jgi:hypothetical protein
MVAGVAAARTLAAFSEHDQRKGEVIGPSHPGHHDAFPSQQAPHSPA